MPRANHAVTYHDIPDAIAMTCTMQVALFLYMGVGCVYFKYSLGITWVQGLYLAVSTVTTVGYGDLTPRQA